MKQSKNFYKFLWYKDDQLIAETTEPRLENVKEYGEYYAFGVDKNCDKKFKSNIIKLEKLKTVSKEDIQDLFADDSHHEIEKAIVEEGLDSTILVNLNYVYNKAELVKESIPVMDEIIGVLKKHDKVRIRIQAHTDCKGSAKYNLDLSQKRAEYVMNHMIEEGISSSRLEAVGMGESSPLKMADCDCEKKACTEAQLALNRRSEFIIIK